MGAFLGNQYQMAVSNLAIRAMEFGVCRHSDPMQTNGLPSTRPGSKNGAGANSSELLKTDSAAALRYLQNDVELTE